MLRNFKQIRLERVANRLNSSAYGQSKDSKYNRAKLKFPVVSKTHYDEPLGQLSSLSSRDWVEKEVDRNELNSFINNEDLVKEDDSNKRIFKITKEDINKLNNIRSLSELSEKTKIPLYTLMHECEIKPSLFGWWRYDLKKDYIMRNIKENLCKYMNL